MADPAIKSGARIEHFVEAVKLLDIAGFSWSKNYNGYRHRATIGKVEKAERSRHNGLNVYLGNPIGKFIPYYNATKGFITEYETYPDTGARAFGLPTYYGRVYANVFDDSKSFLLEVSKHIRPGNESVFEQFQDDTRKIFQYKAPIAKIA